MERKAFQLLHDAESSWWYQGRAHVVSRVLAGLAKKSTDADVLDLGSGWGGMLPTLAPYGKVSALEPDNEARLACKKRGYREVFADIEELGNMKGRFDLIALFDVLEHTKDDASFLTLVRDALRERGSVILTVPAFPFLWSQHDVTHHHYRRYTKDALIGLLEQSGFSVGFASYWNMKLFIPAAIVRLLGRSGESTFHLKPAMNDFLFMIIRLESLLIPHMPLLFGTGIVLYARKK